jgi:hypothetical protein
MYIDIYAGGTIRGVGVHDRTGGTPQIWAQALVDQAACIGILWSINSAP